MATNCCGLRCEGMTPYEYLFQSPFRPNQSLIQKVSIVFFHVLTLFIPLLITMTYQGIEKLLTSCCVSKAVSKDLPQVAKDALQFARGKLQEHPEIQPCAFEGGDAYPPTNIEIARLTSLYLDVYFPAFRAAMRQHRDDPWANAEVVQAADGCMKIAYAIGYLTLEDLAPFTADLAQKGMNRTFAQALVQNDSYLYLTFYYCTKMYHIARGAISWGSHPSRPEGQPEGLSYLQRDIPQTHANLFYQQGTVQNGWNELYNDYCGRIRLYVSEEELFSADNRHANWTRKDERSAFGRIDFERRPDTLPGT
jgi:hypothetical protein